MRKLFCTLALTALLGAGVTALAQDASQSQDAAAPPMHGPRGQGFSPDKQLEHMTKTLSLTSDQQTQIKPLLENQQQQMMQLHQDQSLSREDRMTKAQSIHQDTTTKIEAVLNDQQKQKYEAEQQKMQERMQARRGGGGAQPQPQL